MMETITTRRDDIVGFRIDGTTSEADLKPVLIQLREKLKSHAKVRLYVEYVDTHGFSMDTLIEDLKYNFGHLGHFEKAAVITMKDWLKQAAQLTNMIGDIKLRSFHFSEKDKAGRWIEE
ncbi:STAS/SEC14 domain-containing protein [Catalinimonas sp. 4WD22]|uniref:STAS/SEC14 domain-containing protein n=1 Tax=Catalinimonas locisalis TaxID=3133978 RepID=UPI003100F238